MNDSKKPELRECCIGTDVFVPILGGGTKRYVNFDNAASTPALQEVVASVNELSRWYSNVHRGNGYKSRLSSWAFEKSRDRVYSFVNANPATQIVLFTRNSTESINHLAQRFPFKAGDVVLTTVMEHHSNELPWREVADVVHVYVLPDGRIDNEDFQQKLKLYHGRVALVAVSGASNVTGYINPIDMYARWAHEAGAKIFVDAAQLAPHRRIDMNPASPNEHIDYLAFSAHKMYAPFGVGVLIGDRNIFEQGHPSLVGGGSVDIVTLESVYWTDLPDKEEAGTPNIVGAVALGTAIKFIEEIGWDTVVQHEAHLTAYALQLLRKIPGMEIYGDQDPTNARNRLGVIPFNIAGISHSLLAAILSYEWGIGTRSGCFCAHPYVKCILQVDDAAAHTMEEQILHRDRSSIPGAVRVSFGLYNTTEDIDVLCEALTAIAGGNYRDGYQQDKERGVYFRMDVADNFEKAMNL